MPETVHVPALICCILALVVSIVLNTKWKIHLGVTSAFFAFLIGTGMLNIGATTILGGLPLMIIAIFMFAIPFFNSLSDTGVMSVIAKRIIRSTGGRVKLLPIAFIVAIAVVAFVSEPSVPFVLGPIIASICVAANIDLLIACMILAFAIPFGSANPWTTMTGQMIVGMATGSGFENGVAMQIGVWGNMVLNGIIMILISMIVFKGFKAKNVTIDDSEDLSFNKKQKTAFSLLIVSVVLLVVPSLLNTVIPCALTKWLSTVISIYTVFPLMNVLCVFTGLSTYDETIKRVPWSILVTLSGMMLLVDIAGEAGLSTLLSNFIASNVPVFLIPAVFTFCAAGLSFVATFFAVMPMLWPVALSVAAAAGISPTILISCICIGAIGTGSTSPLSSMGAMILSPMPAEQQGTLGPRMIRFSLITIVIYVVLALLGVYNIIPNLMGV